MEKPITFDNHGIRLEGRLDLGNPRKAAIITHPHPLYGADMDNGVVMAVAGVYQDKGWSTLRFNFRGMGGSQGDYDDGRGEQTDVDAAIACLTDLGIEEIELTGYSFGGWVLACRATAMEKDRHSMRLIAPPVALLDFEPVGKLQRLKQVIAGTADEFAPLDRLAPLVPKWHPDAEFNVIEGADHFYWSHMDRLQQHLKNAIS